MNDQKKIKGILVLILASFGIIGCQASNGKIISGSSNAPRSWTYVGNESFTAQTVDGNISLDSNEVPYVVYSYLGSGYEESVMKLENSTWTGLGSFQSSQFEWGQAITSLDSGSMLIVYTDRLNPLSFMKKYDGSSWSDVPSPTCSGNYNFAKNKNNELFLSCLTEDTLTSVRKVSVYKKDGNNWAQVGVQGFSEGTTIIQNLAIDSNNVPYVSYVDTSVTPNELKVMKFNGSSWENSGTVVSTGDIGNIKLQIDSKNIPYLAYSLTDDSFKASVKKLINNTWVDAGNPGFISCGENMFDMAIYQDTPYLACSDSAYNMGLTLMQYTNESWNYVESPGFTYPAINPKLAINKAGSIYLMFGDVTDQKLSVMKY